jgi:hypothetical protein
MILKDLHLRMVENFQNAGTGYTLFDTRSRVYTITSTDAVNGYASAIVLPKQQFGATVTFTCQARVVSATSANIEMHSHGSAYYGTVFDVRDRHVLTNSQWEDITVTCDFSAPNGAVYPRLNLEVTTAGSVEFRNMQLRIIADSFTLPNEASRRVLEREYGSRVKNSQGVRSTLTGDGAIDDSTSLNYINFSSSAGQAFLTVDDFAGFERNINTEYYILEIDAEVPASTKDAVLKFVFRDAAGGDVNLVCKLTPTIENGVASSESYETYKFIIVQDGSPNTIDEIEIEVGSFTGYEQDFNVRALRLKGYGLTTLNLVQKQLDSCAAIEKLATGWDFDTDYRRENFSSISEFDTNTLQINYDYVTGLAPIPTMTPFRDRDVLPYVLSVSNTSQFIRVQFMDSSGALRALSSISNGFKFFVLAQS